MSAGAGTLLAARAVLDRMTALHDSLFRPTAATVGHIQREIERAAEIEQAQARFFPFHLLPPASAAPLYAAAVARDLFGARAYQITAQYTDLAAALAASFPGFDEYEMPSPYGFAWLDKPETGSGARVITWGLQPVASADSAEDGGPAGGVRLALWDDSLSLIAAVTMTEGQPGTDPAATLARRLWALMDMQMTSAEPAERGAASGYQPRPVSEAEEVRVVELRHRPAHGGSHEGSGEPGTVDWQFCWLVRGHRRRAPHGGAFKSGKASTWVHAYIKGPQDRPLKVPEVLYRLGE